MTMQPMTNWCPARCFVARSDIWEKPDEVDVIRTPGMEVICIIAPTVTKEAPIECHVAALATGPGVNLPMYMFFLLPTLFP